MSSSAAVRLAHREKNAGVAPHHYATLTYPVIFASSSVTAGVWFWQFRLNSLFDPDFTGTGSQPTTFDQWMTLYGRYRVIATDVELNITECSVPSTPIGGVMAPGTDAAPTLTFSGIGGMRSAVFGKKTVDNMMRFRKTFLIKDVLGIDEQSLFGELNYSGTSSTSAPSVAYLTIATQQPSSGGTILVDGFLRFAVRFEDPISNSVSFGRGLPHTATTPASRENPLLVSTPSASTVTSVPLEMPLTPAEVLAIRIARASASPSK
jgi:hypothetical protein